MPAILEVIPFATMHLGAHYLVPGVRPAHALLLVAAGEEWHVVEYCGVRYKVDVLAVGTVEALAVAGWIGAGCPKPGPVYGGRP